MSVQNCQQCGLPAKPHHILDIIDLSGRHRKITQDSIVSGYTVAVVTLMCNWLGNSGGGAGKGSMNFENGGDADKFISTVVILYSKRI